MLIRFRFSNYRSIRDEQELSLVALLPDGRGSFRPHEQIDLELLSVAGIYGANAAGKSNILEALSFMQDAVVNSHRRWEPDGAIPRKAFLLDSKSKKTPSLFEVDFFTEEVRYQYGFKLDSEKILEEWLYAYPNGRKQVWYTRNADSLQPFSFGKNLGGNNRTIETLTRKNSLFLSVAAENNHRNLSHVYSWFSTKLHFIDNDVPKEMKPRTTLELLKNDKSKASVLDLLRLADLGIVDIKIQENPIADEVKKIFAQAREKSSLKSNIEIHVPPSIRFHHQASKGAGSISLSNESNGTQAWFSLIGHILQVIEGGAILCVDELDASLHPKLTLEIIRIFQNRLSNPNGAQLIFNTHDTTLLGNLLGEPGLRRDQVWLVEKDSEGASHLYALTDFKPRRSENLERGYLQGRYGAIPFIEPLLIEDHA